MMIDPRAVRNIMKENAVEPLLEIDQTYVLKLTGIM